MSTIKSSTEHLTLNADGVGKDIKFQANGVEKASISSAGAFTSTSIDATKLSGALPAIDGSALTNLPGGGKVLQVVSVAKTDTFSTTSTTAVDITGMSVSITPTATTSKILVQVDLKGWAQNANDGAVQLLRNGTAIYIADVAGSRARSSLSGFYNNGSNANELGSGTAIFLDSPATTAATTYKLQTKTISASVFINRNNDDYDSADMVRSASSITVMEIGA